MKRHDQKYLKLLKKLDIQEEIFDRYVDDELEGLAAVDAGVRFESGELVMDEDKIEEDQLLADDERTFRLLRDIGNSIFDCIQFTIDVPSLNENGKLPVLDVNLEVVDGKIEHEFFEKTLHIGDCDSLYFCTQQENEDGSPSGGGLEEAEEPHQGDVVGEKQEGDGRLEPEIEEERIPSYHEARGDQGCSGQV